LKKINNKKQNQNQNQNQNRENKSNFRRRLLPGIVLILMGFGFLIVPFVLFAIALIILLILFAKIGHSEITGMGAIDRREKERLRQIMSFYFYLSLVLFAFLGFSENGQNWFVSAIFITGAFDLTAYLVGMPWGNHKIKILSNISPNKSWEGTIAAFVISPVVAWITGTQLLFLEGWLTLVLGLIIAFLAFGGDLFESYYKRVMGPKDSGTIFGGHGGLLDRIDSHLLAVYGVLGFKVLVSLIG